MPLSRNTKIALGVGLGGATLLVLAGGSKAPAKPPVIVGQSPSGQQGGAAPGQPSVDKGSASSTMRFLSPEQWRTRSMDVFKVAKDASNPQVGTGVATADVYMTLVGDKYEYCAVRRFTLIFNSGVLSSWSFAPGWPNPAVTNPSTPQGPEPGCADGTLPMWQHQLRGGFYDWTQQGGTVALRIRAYSIGSDVDVQCDVHWMFERIGGW